MAVDAATTFLFPGQGAQSVGMAVETCEAVPAAKALFDEASEILGYDLLAKCAEDLRRLVEQFFCGRHGLARLDGHADALGALAREQEGRRRVDGHGVAC